MIAVHLDLRAHLQPVRQTKLEIGALTINSTFACLDTGSSDTGGRWGKRDVDALIARCRELYQIERTVA